MKRGAVNIDLLIELYTINLVMYDYVAREGSNGMMYEKGLIYIENLDFYGMTCVVHHFLPHSWSLKWMWLWSVE